MATEDVRRLIDALALGPHPEGGYYRRFHASSIEVEWNGVRRPAMTAIHYLLAQGQGSAWHRVDADEAWHWQQGEALELRYFDPATGVHACVRLGDGLDETATCIVPAGAWQRARALGDHALVACVVAPGFVWSGFELLDPDSALAAELRRHEGVHA